MRRDAALSRGLIAAATFIARRNMAIFAMSPGGMSRPMAVTAAEVRALAADFAFNRQFLPVRSRRHTGIAAARRQARKLRNQRREKRRG